MADLRDIKLGEMVAVINGRQITLHRVIRVTEHQFQVRIKGRQRHKFCKRTGADRSVHPNARIRAYKPTEEQAATIRAELQYQALHAEALHMSHLMVTLVRKANYLPMQAKLSTLRSVILYLGRALKRTSALLPNVEV